MMTYPRLATPPITTNEEAVYEALFDFVALSSLPSIPHENIIRAWQNRAHPPAKSKELIILTLIMQDRRGTNIETFADDVMTSTELAVYRFQVDCYSAKPEIARQRAMTISHTARTSLGIRFFSERGIGCNFTTNARDMTGVGETEEFNPRWMIEIQLACAHAIKYDHAMFDAINVYLENVDVYHPPEPPSLAETVNPDVQTFADGSLPHKLLHSQIKDEKKE